MREASPAVSIVVPCRDGARWLGETLASVEAQTFRRWELVFVDDGSTDASAAIARRYASRDPGRIRCLEHPGGARRGAFASRLLGARRARTPVVALLDADDLWEPDYLRRHLGIWKRLRRRGVALSYGPARYWFPGRGSGAKEFVHPMPSFSAAVFQPGELLQNFLSSGHATMPRTSCSLLRRQAMLELAHLEPAARRFPFSEDQFLMWGIAMRWPVAAHNSAWVRYRQRYPLEARPKSYLEGTLRDEAGFLSVIRGEIARRRPGHPLLRPEGIPARLLALRGRNGRADGAYFFERIPAALRRLGAARR